jgi:hypothetical protein
MGPAGVPAADLQFAIADVRKCVTNPLAFPMVHRPNPK